MSALYILYLVIILPWYVLFILITNFFRRIRNSAKVTRTLRKQGLPEELISKVARNYRRSTKIISIRNIKAIRNQRKKSKKEVDLND